MAAPGTVAAFDEQKGLGSVRADDGRELPFHCTSIAGGSRAIDVGARVTFAVVAGHLGEWQAADVTSVGE